jgi:hypothetical protein
MSTDPLTHECARRCVWFMRFFYAQHFAQHSVPIPPPECDTAVPLPVDEASFDMGDIGHAVLGELAPSKQLHPSSVYHHHLSQLLAAIGDGGVVTSSRLGGPDPWVLAQVIPFGADTAFLALSAEFVNQPAPPVTFQSEFGHACRVSECLYDISQANRVKGVARSFDSALFWEPRASPLLFLVASDD